MLLKVENLIRSLVANLLENNTRFYVVSCVLHFLEDPSDNHFLKIASFSPEMYLPFKENVEALTPRLKKYSKKIPEYQDIILKIVSNTLSNYSRTFVSEYNVTVQSNMMFSLIQSMHEDNLKYLVDYICSRKITDVFLKPQIQNSSTVFSTTIHRLLAKGSASLALKAATHVKDKSILFVQDINGFTTFDVANQKHYHFYREYICNIKNG